MIPVLRRLKQEGYEESEATERVLEQTAARGEALSKRKRRGGVNARYGTWRTGSVHSALTIPLPLSSPPPTLSTKEHADRAAPYPTKVVRLLCSLGLVQRRQMIPVRVNEVMWGAQKDQEGAPFTADV